MKKVFLIGIGVLALSVTATQAGPAVKTSSMSMSSLVEEESDCYDQFIKCDERYETFVEFDACMWGGGC